MMFISCFVTRRPEGRAADFQWVYTCLIVASADGFALIGSRHFSKPN